MRIGITLPATWPLPGTGNTVDLLLDQAAEIAELGADTLWLSQRFDFDAVTMATAAALRVAGIEIGTSVVPVYPRHPVALAAQAQTAQAASHGRFTLGIGLSSKMFVESSFGIPYERPIRHLREYLTVLRSILTEGTVSFDGETVTAHTDIFSAELAGASPPVPLLVAALGPQALRVTGELADGTITYLTGPKALAEHVVPAITRAATEAGRPAPRIVAGIPVVVTDDVAGVRATAAKNLDIYNSIPSYRAMLEREGVDHPADLAVIGDEDTLTDAVRRYADAGATDILLSASGMGGDEDRLRTWRAATAISR